MKLNEPLRKSAPLARAWSEQLCGSCAWYHGAWQYLRLAGVISGITAEADFFQTAFRNLARDGGNERVLVAGSADYGMLAQVIDSYRVAGVAPRLSIVDRCETPLRLNHWYARYFDLEPTLYRADILDFEPNTPFDVICTHSFFSFVAPERHVDLVQRWHALLRPGGHVVTSQSVRPNYPDERVRFTPQQAEEFADRAAEAGKAIDVPMRELATGFAQNKTGFVVRSEEHLRQAFVEGGFDLAHFVPADPGTQRAHRAANPDDHTSWNRIQIVARR